LEGTWVGGALVDARKYALRAPFWIPNEWDVALHRRKGTLFLNGGYPTTLEEEFAMVLPRDARLESLPEVSENRKGPLQWRIEWRKLADGKLAARFHAESSG